MGRRGTVVNWAVKFSGFWEIIRTVEALISQDLPDMTQLQMTCQCFPT